MEWVSVLTNSNVSKDGFFRDDIIKKEHNIPLADNWKSNILHEKTFRRMDQIFLSTVISNLEENINHFCCPIFKANRLKKKGSHKGNVLFWVGFVKCSFRDCQCKGKLSINTKKDHAMTARFSGTILQAVTEIKRRKVTVEERTSLKNFIRNKSCTIQKCIDSLAKMLPSKYETRKRGPTAQAIKKKTTL